MRADRSRSKVGSRPVPPFVWNVSLMGDLVLVGDVNNGLFVLRR